MNETFPDFRGLMSRWPSRAALASEMEEAHWTVEAWWRKNSIPPRAFERLVRVAAKRDIEGVTLEVLLRLHTRRMEQGPPASGSKKNETDDIAAQPVGVEA